MQSGQSAARARWPPPRSGTVPTVTLDRDEVRHDRLLKNEQVFRDYNNRRVAFEQDADAIGELVPFVCECGDPECIEGMEMTVADFTAAHSAPNRFTVKPGHVFPEGERIVESHDRFWLVEKPVVRAGA